MYTFFIDFASHCVPTKSANFLTWSIPVYTNIWHSERDVHTWVLKSALEMFLVTRFKRVSHVTCPHCLPDFIFNHIYSLFTVSDHFLE